MCCYHSIFALGRDLLMSYETIDATDTHSASAIIHV